MLGSETNCLCCVPRRVLLDLMVLGLLLWVLTDIVLLIMLVVVGVVVHMMGVLLLRLKMHLLIVLLLLWLGLRVL